MLHQGACLKTIEIPMGVSGLCATFSIFMVHFHVARGFLQPDACNCQSCMYMHTLGLPKFFSSTILHRISHLVSSAPLVQLVRLVLSCCSETRVAPGTALFPIHSLKPFMWGQGGFLSTGVSSWLSIVVGWCLEHAVRISHNPGFHFQEFFPKEQLACVVCIRAWRVQTSKISLQFAADFVTRDCALITVAGNKINQLFLSLVNGLAQNPHAAAGI